MMPPYDLCAGPFESIEFAISVACEILDEDHPGIDVIETPEGLWALPATVRAELSELRDPLVLGSELRRTVSLTRYGYHGTVADLAPGDLIVPGHLLGLPVAPALSSAIEWAQLATASAGGGTPRVYLTRAGGRVAFDGSGLGPAARSSARQRVLKLVWQSPMMSAGDADEILSSSVGLPATPVGLSAVRSAVVGQS